MISAVDTALAADIGLGLIDGGLELNLVDGEEHLALVHLLTLVYMHLGDKSRHLRADVYVCLTLDSRRIAALELGVAGLYCDDGDFGRRTRALRVLIVASARSEHHGGAGHCQNRDTDCVRFHIVSIGVIMCIITENRCKITKYIMYASCLNANKICQNRKSYVKFCKLPILIGQTHQPHREKAQSASVFTQPGVRAPQGAYI